MQAYKKFLGYATLMLTAVLLGAVFAQALANRKLAAVQAAEPSQEPSPELSSTAEFLDQNGDRFSFQDMGSKPIIVSFTFTGCSMYCSAQAIELKFLQQELNATISANVYQIISVSLTPVWGQPVDMPEFANRFQVDFSNWHFLTGSGMGTESLIANTGLGVKRFTDKAHPDLNHTTVVYLLNADKQIVESINGIPLDKEHLKSSLFQLLDLDPVVLAGIVL